MKTVKPEIVEDTVTQLKSIEGWAASMDESTVKQFLSTRSPEDFYEIQRAIALLIQVYSE